jgi:hypothetical protein
MAALALPAFLPVAALTGNQFEARWDNSAASFAALTKPKEHAFVFPSRGSAYRIVVTTNLLQTPVWIEPTISAFVGVQTLPDNWDSYGARKINRDLISQSLAVLELIMQVTSPAPSVVPLVDGGLQLEWHRKHQDLEIAFTAGDTPQFYYQDRAAGVEQEGFASDIKRLAQLLRNIA